MDIINPFFNIAKIAGSTTGVKQSQEIINKRSKAIKECWERKRVNGESKAFSDKMKRIQDDKYVLPDAYKLYYLDKTTKRVYERERIIICTCMLCGQSHERTLGSLKGLKNKNLCCIREERRFKPKEIKIKIKTVHYHKTTRKRNTSGYVGVVYCKASKQYRARIKHKGKLLDAGRHDDVSECARLRNKYIVEHKLPHPIQVVRLCDTADDTGQYSLDI